MMIDNALTDALQQGLLVSLCLGLAMASAWGLWLLISPDSARRFASSADRWVTTEGVFERLNQPVSSERFFYRHHRAVGALICLGTLYAISRWWFAYDRAEAARHLYRQWVSAGLDWLIIAGEWLYVGFNLVFLVIGVIIIIRPSLLKVPEHWANRWVAVPADQVFDQKFDPLQMALENRPRLLGAVVGITCGALFVFLASATIS